MEEVEPLAAVRTAMLESYSRDSCIAATALACEYLAERGYDGDGIQVTAFVFNAAYMRGLTSGLAPADVLKRDPEAYSVGIGVDGMHVVYLGFRGDDTLFVDLSLDQASRPAHNMVTMPLIKRLDRRMARQFMHGGPLVFDTSTGITIAYRRVRKETFRRSPNWGARDAAVRRTILAGATKLLEEAKSNG
jgi:hypothetical protein